MAVNDDDAGTETVQSTEQSNTTSPAKNNMLPGRRVKNPLGYYSSYAYQISLYLLTPDAMDLFRSTNKQDISILNNPNNAYLVVQSGGINNQTTNTAPGFNLDYYIDDLVLQNATGASTRSATNITDIKFKIIEPYGFSFIKNLKIARDSFASFTGQTRYPNNPTRLPFVLGLGFLGYDENGNVISGNQQYDDLTLDPNADSNRLFNRYYTIQITSIKFKIDGKATVYEVSAKPIDQNIAFGIKNGFINNLISISASTVGEAINQLIEGLNKQQDDLKSANQITYPNVYKIEYRGFNQINENFNTITIASIVEKRDLDKIRWPGSDAQNQSQVNEAFDRIATPDPTKKEITLEKIPVMQGITQIIKQSTYMTDALKTVFTSALEPDPEKRDRPEAGNPSKSFEWYTLSARVDSARWDDKIKDFSYNITYVIEKYNAPIIENPLANPGVGYYGPHKRYEYWYTGQNSEVLKYEQRVDNQYYRVILDTNTLPTTNESQNGISPEIPSIPFRLPDGDKTGGSIDVTLAAQNSVLDNELYDEKSFAEAKITILGDPDFLMEDTIDSPSQVYNQFYGTNNFTINANGGQVFIELDFKEAVDYDYATGGLSINNQLKFWNYPEEANISGLSYQVIKVDSTFSGGTFKQILNCKMTYAFNNSTINTNTRDEGPTSTNSNATTTNTGLRPELPNDELTRRQMFDLNNNWGPLPNDELIRRQLYDLDYQSGREDD